MNHRQLAQFAAMCIEELDAHAGRPLSIQDISRKQGIPLPACVCILRRLSRAGIVSLTDAENAMLLRSPEEVTALEILDAVWTREGDHPTFQMLVGDGRGVRLQKTLEFVRRAQTDGMEEHING